MVGVQKISNSRFQLQPFTTLAPFILSTPVPCPTQSRLIGLPQKRSSGGHSNRNGGRCSELPTTASRFGYSLIRYRHNPREFEIFCGVFPKCLRVLHRWIFSLTLLHSVVGSCASSFNMCHEDFIVSLGCVYHVCLTLRVLCAFCRPQLPKRLVLSKKDAQKKTKCGSFRIPDLCTYVY